MRIGRAAEEFPGSRTAEELIAIDDGRPRENTICGMPVTSMPSNMDIPDSADNGVPALGRQLMGETYGKPACRARIMDLMILHVECYSGGKADERPIRFWLNGKQYLVEAVLWQWREPENLFYKIRADDGNVYTLRQQTSNPEGPWDLA